MARAHTREAIETAVKWMRSDNPKASLQAVQILLDRGHGKAMQSHEISGSGGEGATRIRASEETERWFEERKALLGFEALPEHVEPQKLP